MKILQIVFAAIYTIGYVGNGLLFLYTMYVYLKVYMEVNLGYALFHLLTPLLYFEVIITLLTMTLFWILFTMSIVGLVVGRKLDDTGGY
jgi:hypothetical protein